MLSIEKIIEKEVVSVISSHCSGSVGSINPDLPEPDMDLFINRQ
jgi:hypothetical protein